MFAAVVRGGLRRGPTAAAGASAAAARRSWFGFGMPREETPSVPVPWYLRQPVDDSAEFSKNMMLSEAEIQARTRLNERILAAAEAGGNPSLELYTAVADLLVQFEDLNGMDALVRTMTKAKLSFDAATQTKVDAFLEKARAKAYLGDDM